VVATAVGAGIGGLLAAKFLGKGAGKIATGLIGGVIGGAIGNLVGRYFDERSCEMDKIAAQNGIALQHEKVEFRPTPAPEANGAPPLDPASVEPLPIGETTRWPENAFPFGSAELTSQARNYFTQAARLYLPTPPDPQKVNQLQGEERDQYIRSITIKNEMPILLVGNTDDIGDSRTNQRLSEARARTVGEVFRSVGVDPKRIFYWGAGETRPIASNETEDGRTKNRRVDSIEFSDTAALMTFIQQSKPKTEFYRPAKVPTAPTQQALQQSAALPSPAQTAKPAASEIPKTVDQPAAAPERPSKAKKTASAPAAAVIDFGGGKASPPLPSLYDEAGGARQKTAFFGLVSEAHAAVPPTASCTDDRARHGGTVRSLATDKPVEDYKTNEFIPGLYNVPWGGIANNNLVALNGMAVLKSNIMPAANPTIMVYPGWSQVSNKQAAKPVYSLSTTVNTYDGQNGFVFRVFPEDSKVLSCMDLLIPYSGLASMDGRIHYYIADVEYVAGFAPAMLR
jgi:outer membrane protein OmpA-like peptidoglycan-associated protein